MKSSVLAFSVVLLTIVSAVGIGGIALGKPGECASPRDFMGKTVFPADNIWNAPVDTLPVDSRSDAYVGTIGLSQPLHPDFSNISGYGIPFCVVDGAQPKVYINYVDYGDESDPGPFPIPPNAPVEGGSDRHVLVVDSDNWILYELYTAEKQANNSWNASSGAKFDLNSNALRPDTWTSCDAAGLPIFPGLVRYDEVNSGVINHAIRFTAPQTQKAYVWPARHYASSIVDPDYPPMGQRFRLKSSVDISGYPPDVQVVLVALKKYGMMLADNGASWYITGAPDSRWDDDSMHEITNIKGSDFEAVNVSSLMADKDSGMVNNYVPELGQPFLLMVPCATVAIFTLASCEMKKDLM